MTVDRYTKLMLTVIAVCLVWLSVGGPSLITPVSAQGDRVYLAGWVDEKGHTLSLPAAPPIYDTTRLPPYPERPRLSWPLPMTETVK